MTQRSTQTRRTPGQARKRSGPEPIQPTAIYSRSEVCKLLRMSDERLKGLTDTGAIRAKRDGQRLIYLGQALLDWAAKT